METPLVGTGVRLHPDHITKLDQIAKAKRVSRNVVILWALDEYLSHFSLPDRLSGKTDDQVETQTSTPVASN